MGYESGKGLGKNKQGITQPVEAKLRKGRAAVGAYGSERTQRSLQDYPVYDSEEEEDKQFKNQLHQWRKKSEVRMIYCIAFIEDLTFSNKYPLSSSTLYLIHTSSYSTS